MMNLVFIWEGRGESHEFSHIFNIEKRLGTSQIEKKGNDTENEERRNT